MSQGTHYNLTKIQCLAEDKSTVRMLFAVAAAQGWPMEHIDIVNAYAHDPPMHSYPIYVRQLPDSIGNYIHANCNEKLAKSSWGGISTGPDYIQELFAHMIKREYIQSDVDPSLLAKCDANRFIHIMVTIDYFSIVASTAPNTQQFHEMPTDKYSVKLFGRPVDFPEWSVNYRPDGNTHGIYSPLAQASISNAVLLRLCAVTRPIPMICNETNRHRNTNHSPMCQKNSDN